MFWFKKKKKQEKVKFPYHYVQIVWTKTAIHDGIFDDYNKEIQRIKAGEIVQIISYTKEDLNAIINVYKIPFIDLTKLNVGKDFEFNEMMSLSGIILEER